MAFPTTGILSDFAGTAVTPPPGFTNKILTTEGNLQTSGTGTCQLNSGSEGTGWWNAGTFGPDVEVFCTLSVKQASGDSIRLYARLATPGTAGVDGYIMKVRAQAGTDTWEMHRIDNAVETKLGADIGTQEISVGDGFGFTVVGSVLTAWYRPGAAGTWVQVGATRTDATYSAAGYIGLGLNFSTCRLDDFGGGTISAGGTALTLSLSDSATPSETITRAQGFGLSLTDSTTPSEVLNRAQAHSLSLADTANADDGVFGTSQGFAATLIDNANPSDLLLLAKGGQQSFVDSALVTDALTVNVVAPDTPCKPDAVCGIPICGAAICGAWWTCPSPVGIGLGASPPSLLIEGDIVIPSGMGLGATVPGLVIDQTLVPPSAGLAFGAIAAQVASSSAVAVSPAGLGLGAGPVTATLVWMLPIDCTDLELQPDSERELVLVGAASSDLALDPQECL